MLPEGEPHADLAETRALLQSARAGDEAACETLFERYIPCVRQIVALRMGRRMSELLDCDDLVQDTLLDAFRGLDRFDPQSRGAFRHWLAKLVENRIRDRARQDAAQKRGEGRVRPFAAYESAVLSSSIFAGREPAPSQSLRLREFEQELEGALLTLDPRERQVIELRRLCELSYEAIGREMDLEPSSVRSLFSRALSKLSAAI